MATLTTTTADHKNTCTHPKGARRRGALQAALASDIAADIDSTEIRLCRHSTAAEVHEGEPPQQQGIWLAATARNREMLQWFMQAGMTALGTGSHWIEERSAAEPHIAHPTRH